MGEPVRIFLVSGSTRATSTNTATLKTVQAVAPEGVTKVLYEGLSDLAAFNPDGNGERPHSAVAELRKQLVAADAVLFCTPGVRRNPARQLQKPARLDCRQRRTVWQAGRVDQRGQRGPG